MAGSDAGLAHVRDIGRLQATAILSGRRTWARVNPGRVAPTWLEQLQLLVPLITTVQTAAATQGSRYAADVLAEQGSWVPPEAFTNPRSLSGWAPDGRTLQGLLYSPAATALGLIGQGMPAPQALDTAGRSLDMILTSVVSDTARQAGAIDVAARDGVGWIRMVNPPSCARCAILAGRLYRWNDGFLRHPRCLPAGTVVSGPQVEAATRRWYEGELVVIRTAAGKELSITGNHPVLTDKGWVPAHLVQEGDQVVRSTRLEGATPLVVPDEQQAPALIEDVRSAHSMVPLGQVPASAKDFHGDGLDGQVDVVLADRFLRHRGDPAATEFLLQPLLSGRTGHASGLDRAGSGKQLLRGLPGSSHCSVRSAGLSGALLGSHLGGANESGLRHATHWNAGLLQAAANHVARNAEPLAERVLALSGPVGGRDFVDRERDLASRWDPATATFSPDDLEAYSGPGLDLLARLTGQVELDRVVEVERISWSGHVYNLSTVEGWYSADGLIVSNCDCIHRPAHAGSLQAARDEGLIQDPYEYFRSLPAAEQDRVFTRSGAAAIRDGADMSRVVNARRGMTGNGLFTTEGMGRRGFARQQLGRGQRRLTPEGLARMYPDRGEYLKALRQHGYVLPGGQQPLGSIKGALHEGYGELGRGGTRVAARQAVEEARATGVRTGSRYTMTAAERRVYDAKLQWQAVLEGRNPYGGRLTPQIAATVEGNYRRQLANAGQQYTRAEDALEQAEKIVVRAGGTGGGGGRPPRAPANLPADDEGQAFWMRRQDALGIDTGGDLLKPIEIESLERLQAVDPLVPLQQKIRWIPKRADGISTNDFIWMSLDAEKWELKSPAAKYRTIRDRIKDAMRNAAAHGVVKDRFLIDIGDVPLSSSLRNQLAHFNLRREGDQLAALQVLSRSGLEQIQLL